MKRKPAFLKSTSTMVVMVIIVVAGFVLFDTPIQVLLIIASAYAIWIAKRVGLTWQDLEKGTAERLSTAIPTVLIILTVGIIVGSWVFSGTVPALIYYGLDLLNPSYFLISAFFISAVTPVTTGTAWGSASTAGIVLISVGNQLGIPPGMATGAIITGAVFDDRMSPLSDTTNLVVLVTKVNILKHIRSMMWTTIPASIIGLLVWFTAGFQFKGHSNDKQIQTLLSELAQIYQINIWVWIPLVVIIVYLLFKMVTVPAMLISGFSAIIVGIFNHHFKMTDSFKATFSGFNESVTYQSHVSSSVKSLLEQGGMMSMTQILVTIFCGYAFASIVEKAGCLEVLLTTISKGIHSIGSLICITVICCIAPVFTAGVAPIVVIMVDVLMKDLFERYQVSRSVLSKTLEDLSTMVSPLIPWGTSGIYCTNQLHVSVEEFFIWTVSCYLCAIIAIIYDFTGIGIKKSSNSRLT